MALYKVGFRNRSANERIAISERFITNVVKVPAPKRPLVRLGELEEALATATAARADYVAVQTELRAARQRYAQAVKVLCDRVTLNVIGLSNGVGNDEAGYLAAGLQLPAPRRSLGRPSAPTHLRVERLAGPGRARLRWNRPLRRGIFSVQVTEDPKAEKGWKEQTKTTKQSVVLKNLHSAMWQWVRVAGFNAHGQGPWSQPVRVLPE